LDVCHRLVTVVAWLSSFWDNDPPAIMWPCVQKLQFVCVGTATFVWAQKCWYRITVFALHSQHIIPQLCTWQIVAVQVRQQHDINLRALQGSLSKAEEGS